MARSPSAGMQKLTKVLLREELYERVWTTAMYRLAKEFGYSDVGLAKLCKKHNIPRPGFGYCRRIELGQKPERLPLPVVEQPSPYRIGIPIPLISQLTQTIGRNVSC